MAQLDFWTRLPKATSELITKNTHVKSYKRGSLVYSSGESPIGIYIVKVGLMASDLISKYGGIPYAGKSKTKYLC